MKASKPSVLDLTRLGPSAWLAVAAAIGIVAGLLAGQASAPLVLLALAVGGVGTAAILALPELGLVVLVFTSYISLSNVLIQFYGAPSIAKFLVPLVLLAILLRWARSGERPRGWRRPAVLLLVYGVACTLSLLTARDPGLALDGLSNLAKDGLVFILIVILLDREAMLRRVVWTLIAAAIFMGTIGVHQQLTGNFDFSYWGFGRAPEIFSVEGESIRRLGGPIGDPNLFGLIMLSLVPMAFDRALGETRWRLKIPALWAALATSMSVVFTYSRSALLSFVAVLALFVGTRRPRPSQLAAGVVLALMLLPLVPGSYVHRLSELASSVAEITERGTTREVSVRGRLSENLVATEMFLDHPVLGVGLANYPSRYQEYSRRFALDPRASNRPPHNLYLEVLAETGLVGFSAFALLLWVALRGALTAGRELRAAGRTDLAHLSDGLTLGFVGYLIASIFLHALYPRYFWVLAGIVVALPRVAASETRRAANG